MDSILGKEKLLERLEAISRTIGQEPDIAHYDIPVDNPTYGSKSLQSIHDGLLSGRIKVENFVETYPQFRLGYDPRSWWKGLRIGLNADTIDKESLKNKFSSLPHARMKSTLSGIIDSEENLEKMVQAIENTLLEYGLQFCVVPQIQLTNSYLLFGTIHLPNYLQILANIIKRYGKIYETNEAILSTDLTFAGLKALFFDSWVGFKESRDSEIPTLISLSQAHDLLVDLSHYVAEHDFPCDNFTQPMITTYWDNMKAHRDLATSSEYVLKRFNNFQLHPTMYQPLLTSAINLNNSFANPHAFVHMKKFFRVVSTLKQPIPKASNNLYKKLKDCDTLQYCKPRVTSPSHIEV